MLIQDIQLSDVCLPTSQTYTFSTLGIGPCSVLEQWVSGPMKTDNRTILRKREGTSLNDTVGGREEVMGKLQEREKADKGH